MDRLRSNPVPPASPHGGLRLVVLCLALGLQGCLAGLPLTPRVAPIDLGVTPRLVETRTVQASIRAKTGADIARLDVLPLLECRPNEFRPLAKATGLPTTMDDPDVLRVTQATPSLDFNRTITMRRLKAFQRYRVVAQAFDAYGNLISRPEGSYLDLTLDPGASSPSPLSLPIQLADTPFAARVPVTLQASGSVPFTDVVTCLVAVSGESEIPLPGTERVHAASSLPKTLSLANLRANTRYRLKAVAREASGAELVMRSIDLAIGIENAPPARTLVVDPPYPAYSLPHLVFWGDSLTEGAGVSNRSLIVPVTVARLMGGRRYHNGGLGGNGSLGIAARAKAIPTLVTVSGDTLPATGSVQLTNVSTWLLNGAGTRRLSVTIAGVPGILERINQPAGGGPPQPYVFIRSTPGEAVHVAPGTPLGLDNGDMAKWTTIIWAGRNDAWSKPDTILANIRAIVDAIDVQEKRFVILSVLNGQNEGTGTTAHRSITTLNETIRQAYPSNFLDVRASLAAGTPDDTVPANLRADSIHLNDAGYGRVADEVSAFLRDRQW